MGGLAAAGTDDLAHGACAGGDVREGDGGDTEEDDLGADAGGVPERPADATRPRPPEAPPTSCLGEGHAGTTPRRRDGHSRALRCLLRPPCLWLPRPPNAATMPSRGGTAAPPTTPLKSWRCCQPALAHVARCRCAGRRWSAAPLRGPRSARRRRSSSPRRGRARPGAPPRKGRYVSRRRVGRCNGPTGACGRIGHRWRREVERSFFGMASKLFSSSCVIVHWYCVRMDCV